MCVGEVLGGVGLLWSFYDVEVVGRVWNGMWGVVVCMGFWVVG